MGLWEYVKNLVVKGDLEVKGRTVFKGPVTGAMLINPTIIDSDLVPDITCTRDVGTPGNKWRNGYFNGVVEGEVALQTGSANALPVAGAAYRGQSRIVFGGAGARDRKYVCHKSDAGVYNWVEESNGGA